MQKKINKNKEYDMLKLFERYIRESRSGTRLKPNLTKISDGTIKQYVNCYKRLQLFATEKSFPLRIRDIKRLGKREMKAEKKYWSSFYSQFTDYLYQEKNCHDNYVGHLIKNIRSFLNYLSKEKQIQTTEISKLMYVPHEHVPIITISPKQLKFLRSDRQFEEGLNKTQRLVKDIFVVGCSVGLRISDLNNLHPRHLLETENGTYLSLYTQKTKTPVKIKLANHVVEIIKRRRRHNRLLPKLSLKYFNAYLKEIAEKAGWTHEVIKTRSKRGVGKSNRRDSTDLLRFCDLISSHTMRRTTVTNLLMMGMPENLVRKISGHTPGSKEFHRYVEFTQTYVDLEVEKANQKMDAY